jgi:hypothetical protein
MRVMLCDLWALCPIIAIETLSAIPISLHLDLKVCLISCGVSLIPNLLLTSLKTSAILCVLISGKGNI